jgi:hypothetical protein
MLNVVMLSVIMPSVVAPKKLSNDILIGVINATLRSGKIGE